MTTDSKKGLHEDNSRVALADYVSEVSSKSNKLPQYLAAILATVGAFSAGTCLSWSSPAIPILLNGDDGNSTNSFSVTKDQASWIGALVTLGAFTGAIPAGNIAHYTGRKRLVQILAIPMFLSWILIAFSECAYGLYFARYLAGIVIGAYSVAIPLYVAELAEPRIRGTLGTLFQLQINAGILFQYIVGMSGDLKIIALTSSVIPILFLIAFSFMPESPVHLSNMGRVMEAKTALQWLRSSQYDVEEEITRIQDQLQEAKENKGSIFDLVKSRAAYRGLIIALGLMIFQQLSGINAVIFYTESIFRDCGSSLPSYVPAITVGVVSFLSTYMSTILIDKSGRRILLLISCSVMTLCLGLLALCFGAKTYYGLQIPVMVPVLSVAVYISVFSLGFGPIPWMMLGELFSPRMKGPASSISAAFNWMLAFSVTKLFQDMTDMLGTAVTFAIFAGICAAGTAFVFFLVPETKGKDMDEIQQMLGGYECKSKSQTPSESSSEDIVVIDVKK